MCNIANEEIDNGMHLLEVDSDSSEVPLMSSMTKREK